MHSLCNRFKELLNSINRKRAVILRHLAIYFLVLLIAAPFVYLNRSQIYSTILSRHDQYIEYTNDEGLPVTDYGIQAGVYVGEKITPRAVANKAISYYEEMLEGNSTAELYFNNTIRWLVDHNTRIRVPTENGSVEIVHWYFDFAIWDLPSGWYQSMADAKAIHALSLAYNVYGNETYKDIAVNSIQSFEIPTTLGGHQYILEDGTCWYPEYSVPKEIDSDYEPYLVLNGFLFALYHLYLANQIFNMSMLEDVFNKGVISAAANLYKYDMDIKWTKYHLAYPVKLAPRRYHAIHILYTGELYEFTNVTVFKTYHDKWSTYTQYPIFSWEEITSPEFICFGFVVAGLILGPVIVVDVMQHLIRSKRKTQDSD